MIVAAWYSSAVPHGEDVGFTPGEVAGMGGAGLICRPPGDELLLGELADRLQLRESCSPC